MTNEEIVVVSMCFATLVVVTWKTLQNAYKLIRFKKMQKRTAYLKELLKEEKVPFTLIDLGDEPNRIAPTPSNEGLIIDKKEYNEKNAFFMEEDGIIYVMGIKEDYIIALVKANFDYSIR